MDYDKIKAMREELDKRNIPAEILEEKERDFEAEYAYNSLALSGSSLTLDEVKAILAAERKRKGGK